MSRISELTEKRNNAWTSAKAILDGANEKTGLTVEQRKAYDSFNAEIDDLDEDIKTEHRMASHNAIVRTNSLAAHGYEPRGRGASSPATNLVPSLAEYRALTEGSGPGGGYLVPVETANDAFSYLATKSIVLGSGVRVLTMTEQTLNVPRISAGSTVQMFAEAATITEGDPTFAQMPLVARKAGAFVLVSNEVLADSNPAVRALVSQDLLAQLARFLDAQFLQGNGTAPNLRGIRNFAGITATPMGANGAAITSLDPFASALARAESGNNDDSDLVWMMHPRTFGEARLVKDSQSRYLLDADASTGTPRSLFGIPVQLSSAISTTETQGTGTTCSTAFLVNKTQVVVGQRAAIQVAFSSDYAFQADQTAIKATARFDIGLLDPNGVQLVTGIL